MTRTEKARRGAIALIGEAEMAVRLIEAIGQCRRPAGVSAEAMLTRHTPADVAAGARRQARAAIAYIAECVAAGKAPQ